ncbi:SMI1/KNR4 family protein [Lentzea alba]|uniref:hypothetical protein n=1 Tax=Lentzea alba TaxID=2714351 RepID=UPI0039BFAF0D
MTVEGTWAQVDSWVQRKAPALHAAFLPPVDGRLADLPSDLAAWWGLFGGVDRVLLGDSSPLIPEYFHPLGADAAVQLRDTCLSTSAGWLPGWLPIAIDFEGEDVLFVDLRGGAVWTCEHGHGPHAKPTWPSVTAMLEHLWRMLRHNDDPVHRLSLWSDGHLSWDVRPVLTPDSRPVQ